MPVISTPLKPNLLARIAGAVGLAIFLAAIYSEGVVQNQIVDGSFVNRTLDNIIHHQDLYLSGIIAACVVVILEVFYAFILFRLFRKVNVRVALMALLMRYILIGFLIANILGKLELFQLIQLGETVSEPDLMKMLSSQSRSYQTGLIFFSIHIFCLGFLVFHSGFLPRWIGVLLFIAGFSYLIGCSAYFFHDALYEKIGALTLLPPMIGEMSLTLWLLIKGLDIRRWNSTP